MKNLLLLFFVFSVICRAEVHDFYKNAWNEID